MLHQDEFANARELTRKKASGGSGVSRGATEYLLLRPTHRAAAACYSASMAEHELALPTAWGQLAGTLSLPEGRGPWPAVLLIAGAGPTDRDGNNSLLGTHIDNLKRLARALAARGIASLRYDKRGVGA